MFLLGMFTKKSLYSKQGRQSFSKFTRKIKKIHNCMSISVDMLFKKIKSYFARKQLCTPKLHSYIRSTRFKLMACTLSYCVLIFKCNVFMHTVIS